MWLVRSATGLNREAICHVAFTCAAQISYYTLGYAGYINNHSRDGEGDAPDDGGRATVMNLKLMAKKRKKRVLVRPSARAFLTDPKLN